MAGNKKSKRKKSTGSLPIERVIRRAVTRATLADRRNDELIEHLNNTLLGHPDNLERLNVTFAPIENWLTEQETTGESEVLNDGTIILRTPGHLSGKEWFSAVDAFHNIAETFEYIAEKNALQSMAGPFKRMVTKLKVDMPLFQVDIDAARQSVAWMKEVAKRFTPLQITEYTRVIETREHLRELKLAA